MVDGASTDKQKRCDARLSRGRLKSKERCDMSQWSRKMRERAGRYAGEAKRKRTLRCPLRKVVGFGPMPSHPAVLVEFLSCGHFIMPRRDLFGETHASRRRCWKCLD